MENKNEIKSFLSFFSCFSILIFINYLDGMINTPQFPGVSQSANFNVGQNNDKNNNINQSEWRNVTPNNSLDISNRQFNWQQRKVLKQKAYKIYINLNMVIEDINDIVSRFSLKIEDINQVVLSFNNAINVKCNQLNQQYNNLNDFLYDIDIWTEKINLFKNTVYYNLHKDFRKKIDAEAQNFENINNMINHYQNSIVKMYKLQDVLINGVNDLYSFQKTALAYEDLAWSKYQQLDELINDKIAENNFLEINNASDNAILINTYLRNEFLDFFNQNMTNLNKATSLILIAVDDLILHINETNLFIASLESEIKTYDDNIEKEKLSLELEEKKKIEFELKLKNDKKQKELEMALAQRGFFEKASSFISLYFGILQQYVFNFYEKKIKAGFSYFNSIFYSSPANINNAIKKNNNTIIPSQEVSSTVSQIPVSKDTTPDIVLFSSPEINSSDIKIDLIKNNDNNKNSGSATVDGVPGETKIEDVFSENILQGYNQEKDKVGASSYPRKINIEGGGSLVNNPPIINTQADNSLEILLPSTENIVSSVEGDTVVNKEENQPQDQNNLFKYKSTELDNNQVEKDIQLLPDLSNLEQRSTKITSSGVGLSQNQSVQFFEATSGSQQRRSRSRSHKTKEERGEGESKKIKKKDDENNAASEKTIRKKIKKNKKK